jgi:Protein of unknown function (DUF2934)
MGRMTDDEHGRIERRAFAIWQARGCTHGHDIQDWLMAETEIRSEAEQQRVSGDPVPITRVILACDESGAKGYANQDEAYDGEVGVFAGIMVSDSQLTAVEADFTTIYDKYKPTAGKLHIAELAPASQDGLRQDIYAAVRKHKLPCFWYALHVAGVHRHHIEFQRDLQGARADAEAHSTQPGRFKGGSPRENPASIHVLLFEGLYAHLVAFLEERARRNVEIEVRTDRIDNPIVDRFEEVSQKLLGDMIHTHTSTRFDTFTNEVVEGKMRVEAHIPASMQIELIVRSLQIHAVDNDDGIVLGADVIANHLNYLFKNRDTSEKYDPLNWPTAVRKHPLKDHLDAFYFWGNGDPIGDGIYKHPKAV